MKLAVKTGSSLNQAENDTGNVRALSRASALEPETALSLRECSCHQQGRGGNLLTEDAERLLLARYVLSIPHSFTHVQPPHLKRVHTAPGQCALAAAPLCPAVTARRHLQVGAALPPALHTSQPEYED
jgi:hypothetical protein